MRCFFFWLICIRLFVSCEFNFSRLEVSTLHRFEFFIFSLMKFFDFIVGVEENLLSTFEANNANWSSVAWGLSSSLSMYKVSGLAKDSCFRLLLFIVFIEFSSYRDCYSSIWEEWKVNVGIQEDMLSYIFVPKDKSRYSFKMVMVVKSIRHLRFIRTKYSYISICFVSYENLHRCLFVIFRKLLHKLMLME